MRAALAVIVAVLLSSCASAPATPQRAASPPAAPSPAPPPAEPAPATAPDGPVHVLAPLEPGAETSSFGSGGVGLAIGSGPIGNASPGVGLGVAPQGPGHLDRDVIRRVVQRHVPDVRDCYEDALVASPGLQGRVAVRFVIGVAGRVRSAVVAESTVGSQVVEDCIAGEVATWRFPQPEGGEVVVSYPFILRSDD